MPNQTTACSKGASGNARLANHSATSRVNRPPTDVAVEASYLGMYVEWGWADFSKQRVGELIHGAVELGSDLSPERREELSSRLVRSQIHLLDRIRGAIDDDGNFEVRVPLSDGPDED